MEYSVGNSPSNNSEEYKWLPYQLLVVKVEKMHGQWLRNVFDRGSFIYLQSNLYTVKIRQ